MSRDLFTRRLRASALSMWELGDLLGIHPHHLRGFDSSGGLAEQPIRVVIDLCRQLDIHPADLLPALEAVLDHRRDHDETGGAGSDADGLTVLTALAHTLHPLTVAELSEVLDWTLERTTAALEHAALHPKLSGPLALRRVPPDTVTVAARLDILTSAQQTALAETDRYRSTLTNEEAETLLAVVAFGKRADYADFRAEHLDAEHALKLTGLIHSDHNPNRAEAAQDVAYSLRLQGTGH